MSICMFAGDYEVKTDGRTIWVTAPTGYTIARFSRLGIDVHTPEADGCLDCRPGPFEDLPAAFTTFNSSLIAHYGISLPAGMCPR